MGIYPKPLTTEVHCLRQLNWLSKWGRISRQVAVTGQQVDGTDQFYSSPGIRSALGGLPSGPWEMDLLRKGGKALQTASNVTLAKGWERISWTKWVLWKVHPGTATLQGPWAHHKMLGERSGWLCINAMAITLCSRWLHGKSRAGSPVPTLTPTTCVTPGKVI